MRRKKRFNIVKALRKMKNMIKLGLILAIIFLILCLLLWLWDLFQNGGLDIMPIPKRHYSDMANSIHLLQEEIEMLKAQNSVLQSDVSASQALILHQNELINDIQETINNPSWHTGGVQYHYEVVETTENYQVLEFEEANVKAEVPKVEISDVLSGKMDIPIMIGIGITIISAIFGRGIPAF